MTAYPVSHVFPNVLIHIIITLSEHPEGASVFTAAPRECVACSRRHVLLVINATAAFAQNQSSSIHLTMLPILVFWSKYF